MLSSCAELYNTNDETINKKRKEMFSPCAELSNTKDKTRDTKGMICTLPVLNSLTQKIRKETQTEGDVISLCWIIQHKRLDKKQKKEGDVISLCWIIQDQSVEGDTLPAKSHLACH